MLCDWVLYILLHNLSLECFFVGRKKIKPMTTKCKMGGENEGKREFQGKLSHNPTSPSARITRFFPPQVPKSLDTSGDGSGDELTATAGPVIVGRTSPRRHASTMSVLQQANSEYTSTHFA